MSENLYPYTRTKPAEGAVAWTSYAPALTSNGSNPNVGTGGSVTGRYRLQPDKTVHGLINVVFGTASTSAGTGTYLLTLPVAPSTALTYTTFGTFYAYHNPSFSTGVVNLYSGSQIQLLSAAPALVSASSPWAWGANDVIVIRFTYEAA